MVAAEVGDDFPESLERVVEAVHATTLAGVGGDATFAQNRGRRWSGKNVNLVFKETSLLVAGGIKSKPGNAAV